MENYLTECKTLNIFNSNKDSLIKLINNFKSNSDLIQGLRIQ